MAEKKKFEKECPECHKMINTKGWLNHVRKHGINPEAAPARTMMDLTLEKVLREEAQKILADHPEILEEEVRKILREQWPGYKEKKDKSGEGSDEPGSNKAA